MAETRLQRALDEGLFSLPLNDDIAVIGPAIGADLSWVPKKRCIVVQRHAPAHRHWASRGFHASVELPDHAGLAVVHLPRSRQEAMHLIARAAHIAPAVVIDGQKIDGVDSILKALRPRGGVSASLSKAKGKVFVVQGAALEDWVGAGETAIEGGFFTRPGIFSADGVDPGSRLLAQALPQNLPATVADLGAGWGFLARAVLARDGVETLHLVESDHWALDCARRNVQDPRAQFHWADALDWSPGQPLDTIVMNPPFHQGRTADPALGQAFIRAAARLLNRHGTLWLVANRHLPYEKTLEETFREVRPVGHDPAFKLYQAQHPRAL